MLGGTAAALLQGCGVASPLGQTSLPEAPRPGASQAPAGATPSPTRALLQNENRPGLCVLVWRPCCASRWPCTMWPRKRF